MPGLGLAINSLSEASGPIRVEMSPGHWRWGESVPHTNPKSEKEESKMKAILKVAAMISLMSVVAHAGSGVRGNVQSVSDPKTLDLQLQIRRLEARLSRVERELGMGSSQPYPNPSDSVCLIQGTYSKSWYIGKGSNRLDAEFSARKSCQDSDSWGAGGCTAAVTCDSADIYGSTKTCLLTGTYSKVMYRGSGSTKLEANYAVRKSCEKSDSWGAGGCQGDLVCSE